MTYLEDDCDVVVKVSDCYKIRILQELLKILDTRFFLRTKVIAKNSPLDSKFSFTTVFQSLCKTLGYPHVYIHCLTSLGDRRKLIQQWMEIGLKMS